MKKKESDRPKAMIPATVSQDRSVLVSSNPRVKTIAFRFRWSADTVVKRVQNSLTSVVEQRLYLQVAGDYRIQPESLLKLLEVFRGSQDLQESDLRQVSVGKNLVKSRFDDIMEKVGSALILIDKTEDSSEYRMSMNYAARLVEAYGENAIDVLGQIVENVSGVAKLLRISSSSSRTVVGVAIKVLVEDVVGEGKGQCPIPLTIEEMFLGRGGKKRIRYE